MTADFHATVGYDFALSERPVFPGSPFNPSHPFARRLGYAMIALLLPLTASFGNALVSVNYTNISGELGVYVVDGAWLPAIYAAMNACANLMMVKSRIRFGIPALTQVLLVAYALAALGQVLVPGFSSALLIRAIAGLTAAGLTTLTTYYLMQSFPASKRPVAVLVAISLGQLTSPLARLVPLDLLVHDHWRGLYLIELSLPLLTLGAMLALPLPPTETSKAFRPLDFVIVALLAPAITVICGALSVGRFLWWTDTPWMGPALAIAVVLVGAALAIEMNREQPLLHLEWMSRWDIVRFAVIALFGRLALAEQSYGAVGLLGLSGLTNDQYHLLFAIVVLAMIAGIVTAAVTFAQSRLRFQVMVAALCIAFGAWLDSGATNLSRPPQLYLSQALLGFGTTLFIGPGLVFGFLRMIARGPEVLISFLVLFSMTQNIGGLAGAGFLGSFEIARVHAHTQAIDDQISAGDPQVVAALRADAGGISGVVADPFLRSAEGVASLGRSINREANIRAFNDVFQLIALLGVLIAIFVGYPTFFESLRRLGKAKPEVPR
jgi:MFS family permease